jgi:GT2 family glycosyltransferase
VAARLTFFVEVAHPMSDIEVAVVIVSYKSADLTIDCLRSIEAERATPGLNIRAIVVDNASGDAPPIAQAIAANDWTSWATLIESPRNGGYAYGNNLAFRRAYEDGAPAYFHLLNPDTRVLPGAIRILVDFLENNPSIGIAGSGLGDVDDNDWAFAFRFPSMLSEFEHGLQFGLISRLLKPWIVAIETNQKPRQVDWVSGASKMVRREVLDAIGGLDENYFLYFEDSDFCYRAQKAGFSTWSVPASRIMHVSGQSTQVTGHHAKPMRVPGYWFESRRRYFAVHHGYAYAIATDLFSVIAHGLGTAKRRLQGRLEEGQPFFIRDLIRHSLIWPTNRNVAPVKNFLPPASASKISLSLQPHRA